MDAANKRDSDTRVRAAARNWRTSSIRRAGKLGRILEGVPSIDAVHAALLGCAKFCAYCQTPVDFTKKRRMNLDHSLPISRGGDASLANMVIACGPCNRIKGECTAQEFMQLRAVVSGWEDKGKSLFVRLRMGFFSR